MKDIRLKTTTIQLQADTYTPVGIYLRLRDAFPQSLLLECSDYSSRHDSYSYICLTPIMGFEASAGSFSVRKRGRTDDNITFKGYHAVSTLIDQYLEKIDIDGDFSEKIMPGLFGYTCYDAVSLFDNVNILSPVKDPDPIPLLRYDLYQVVIAFNHFNNTLTITEVLAEGENTGIPRVMSLLANRNATSFPFKAVGDENTPVSDERFMEMVRHGIRHCARGDVFQIVLSRRFEQNFTGDEFNVYRALRSINPSPYLFYFDYLSYKLFGSSPEAQLRISDGKAVINPIAGTVIRTGNPDEDANLIAELLKNEKENAEHCMLVDLARNDLSKHSDDVSVETFREVHTYSHVIHLVSTVTGRMFRTKANYRLFADTFPAGTLSGAPKHKAIQLIDTYEETARGFYGGAIGILGL
jgi:anthranilate synthase component I